MRIAELDSLRGLAAVAILVFHLNPPAFFAGWTGVDLFFVLSGYLITGIILRHGGGPGFLATFYVRRGLRIWPIYYLCLAVVVLVVQRMPKPLSLASLPYYATYTQNVPLYLHNEAPSLRPFDHTWTLALEEQFYILWPALVLLAGRARIVPLCLATIAVSVMARADGYLAWGHFSERILLARCDGFALGGLLAAILIPPPSRRVVAGLIFALAGAIAWIVWGSITSGGALRFLGMPTPAEPATTILAVGVVYFGVVGLVAVGAGSPWLAPLRFLPLAYLGKISYGLYLYHYPIFWVIDGYDFVYDQPWRVRVAKLAATLVVAVASWHLVEAPILRLKDRFAYRIVDDPAPGVVH